MDKVYLVYYDNGESYGDHHVHVDKVFGSKESADKYAEEKNAAIQTYTPSVTKEKYESEKWQEQNGYTYNDYIEQDQYKWSMCINARYYVSVEEVLK